MLQIPFTFLRMILKETDAMLSKNLCIIIDYVIFKVL